MLPLNAKDTYHDVTDDDVSEMSELYPGVDVRQELKLMRGWLLGNQKKRKTKSGVLRFIHSWLANAQNSPVPARNRTGLKPPLQRVDYGEYTPSQAMDYDINVIEGERIL